MVGRIKAPQNVLNPEPVEILFYKAKKDFVNMIKILRWEISLDYPGKPSVIINVPINKEAGRSESEKEM